MRLYFLPGACSFAAHVALREAGIEPELIRVQMDQSGKWAHGQDFIEINKKGAVPTLIREDGSSLTENAVILQYIAHSFPAANLMPLEGEPRWRFLEILNFIATDLHKSFSPLFNPNIPEDAIPVLRGVVEGRLAIAAELLKGVPFVTGNNFTIADAYLFTVLSWTDYQNIDLAPWPRLVSYVREIAARPSVKQAHIAEAD